MNEVFSFCDDHFKIFIIVWLKLRELYFESTKKTISIPNIVKKSSDFLKKLRKQCQKIPRFKKISKFVHFLEIELDNSDKFIDKIKHLALIAEIFELPEPIPLIIKQLGFNEEDNLENNNFSKKINDLFKNIDDIDLEKQIGIIENSLPDIEKPFEKIEKIKEEESTIEEGTLLNFLKSKNNENFKKIEYPVDIYNNKNNINRTENNNTSKFRNLNIYRIPRIGATPNPRTMYRHH